MSGNPHAQRDNLEESREACLHDLRILMEGPSSPGYNMSLDLLLLHHDHDVLVACMMERCESVSDEQLFNILDAIMDHEPHATSKMLRRFVNNDNFHYIVALAKKSETRRRKLLWYACNLIFSTHDGECVPINLDAHTATQLAHLAYPSNDGGSAEQLDKISRRYFEDHNLNWEGLQYSIHLKPVRRRLMRVNLGSIEVFRDSAIDAVIKVLRTLRSLENSDGQQLYIRILKNTAPPIMQGLSSCGWFTYLRSVDHNLAFGSVLTPTACLSWLLWRCSSLPMDCLKCRAHAGYYMLLFIDGHTFRKYAQGLYSNCQTEPIHMEAIMQRTVQWFLHRNRNISMDLTRLRQHLSDVRNTFTTADMRIFAPAYAELDINDNEYPNDPPVLDGLTIA